MEYGDRVNWVVFVDAYPRPTLKWYIIYSLNIKSLLYTSNFVTTWSANRLNPRGDEIVGSWMEPEKSKHAIYTTSSSTTLRINRLDFSDMGLYSLQATNADRIEVVNFTLEVIGNEYPQY